MSDDTRVGLDVRPGPPAPMIYAAVFGKLVVLSALLVGLNMVDLAKYNLSFFGYFFQVAFTMAQLAIIATVFMDLPFEERWNGVIVGFGVAAGVMILVLSVIDVNTRGYADPVTGNGVIADEVKASAASAAAAKHTGERLPPEIRWDVAAADEASWQAPPPPPPMPVVAPPVEGAAPPEGAAPAPAPAKPE